VASIRDACALALCERYAAPMLDGGCQSGRTGTDLGEKIHTKVQQPPAGESEWQITACNKRARQGRHITSSVSIEPLIAAKNTARVGCVKKASPQRCRNTVCSTGIEAPEAKEDLTAASMAASSCNHKRLVVIDRAIGSSLNPAVKRQRQSTAHVLGLTA